MHSFETSIRVRYAETDAMGIVHHSRYFVWLELARVEWLRSLGFDYKTMEKEGFFLPVVTAQLQYKSPTFFDDIIKIELQAQENNYRARFNLTYSLWRETTCVAEGFTTHVFLNKDRKLIRPPEFFLQALSTND